ncbi:MAG TPA: YggS family pyridoxal phosphate-dependent enzyme [Porphyromonadaceae bacterium]|nr:YggS family pyridoxal phosphate-dependent enzyme [Porphyromonadaceae bacterium]
MNDIARHLDTVKSTLPAGVSLVAVSKFHPAEALREAYDAGQRIFGESRVQELVAKQTVLPSDIEWHFIGHLQTNKVKQIVPFISLIHSADSPHLLAEVDRCAARCSRVVDCLLQLHIAEEETKFGFSFDECRDYLASGVWSSLAHVRLRGVMGMATLTDDEASIRREFASLQAFFAEIKKNYFPLDKNFSEISMGMSHDYRLALDYGTTMVRVGTLIFGERNY